MQLKGYMIGEAAILEIWVKLMIIVRFLIQLMAHRQARLKCQLKDPYKTVIQMRELKKMTYKNIAGNQGKDVQFEINVQLDESCPLPMELSKVYNITDADGNIMDKFTLIEGDTKKTPFFTEISIKPGKYSISARTPKSLSTIKSQIRNGRAILINETKKEFDVLDEMYL